MRGWVYIITNAAMPDLVKVGYSTKDPDLRAAELSHTGNPLPYVVVYELLIRNPFEIEQKTHALLRDRREGKEWFRCSVESAIKCVREAARDQGLLEKVRIAIVDLVEVESEEEQTARQKEINRQEVFRLAKRIHNIKTGNQESGIVLDELKRFVGPSPDESEINRCMHALRKATARALTPERTRKVVIAVRVKMAVDAPPTNIVGMLAKSFTPELTQTEAQSLFEVLANETGYAPRRDEA